MLKYTLVSLCLIASYVTYARNCRTTEVHPKGYPCYTHADVVGWIKTIVDHGCHAHATEEEFQKFCKCLGDNNPNYVLTGDSLLRYPLQCGEKLIDTSTLPHNATTVDTLRLYCKSYTKESCKTTNAGPTAGPTAHGKSEPTPEQFRLAACAMNEFVRKFELKYPDYRAFKCD